MKYGGNLKTALLFATRKPNCGAVRRENKRRHHVEDPTAEAGGARSVLSPLRTALTEGMSRSR